MKIFRTDDKTVTKFLHKDGSETCIKTVNSIDYKPNPTTGKVDTFVTNRNKYSVFISASQGCPMNCSFCYLTIDNVPFQKLQYHTIIQNVKDSIISTLKDSDLSTRYIKICWMGMGEAIIHKNLVRDGTIEILNWVMKHGYAKGLDGVDISTVLPKVKDYWIDEYAQLNKDLDIYPLNPNNKSVVNKEQGDLVEYKNRSKFRLFYSLHSAIQENRDIMIPNAMPLKHALVKLKALQHEGVNIIFHHMFLNNINDNENELEYLIGLMLADFPENELRILRYNKHDNFDIAETTTFEQCVCFLQKKLKNIKVQVSYGKDIKSACGQFIYNITPDLIKFNV